MNVIKSAIAYIAGTVVVVICAFVILGFVGAAIEGVTDWQIEHERCLKHATNGYEIRRCR